MKRACLHLALALLVLVSVSGEQYLSTAEAEKLCFPGVDRFERQVLMFSRENIRAIEKQAGTAVLTEGVKISSAWKGEELIGVLIFDHVIGKHEMIDYAVALSPSGEVMQVEVLEYRESYGGEIRGHKWRKQFIGKTKRDTLKLHSDIYNISGATLSCRHVTEGIKRDLAIFDLLCRPKLFAAAGRVPKQDESTQ